MTRGKDISPAITDHIVYSLNKILHKGISPFCQDKLASQIFIFILKSLTSDPSENLTFFFLQVMLNCIMGGHCQKLSRKLGRKAKMIAKKEDRKHQEHERL